MAQLSPHDPTDKQKLLKLSCINKRISEVSEFLYDYMPLINAHNTDFITRDHWECLVHPSIQEELLNLTDDQLARLPAFNSEEILYYNPAENVEEQDYSCTDLAFFKEKQAGCEISDKPVWNQNCEPVWKHFSLPELREACEHHTLPNLRVLTPLDEFQSTEDYEGKVIVESFMTDKKCHEVHLMAELCFHLAKSSNTQRVVDIGSGRGYLGCHLSLMHNLCVLGIDSSEVNTSSADQRKQRLEKHWQGLLRNSENPERKKGRRRRKSPQGQPRSTPAKSNYVPITHFVTNETDLMQLVTDHFPFEGDAECGNFMLAGLHTCGNLGASIMRLFASNSDLGILCNIGCCYHLLEEDYLRNPHLKHDEPDSPLTGFPLCSYLTGKKAQIGRNARMLAAQSLERMADGCQLPNVSLFWRAVLQVMLRDAVGYVRADWQVGRVASKCSGFNDYLRRCWDKLQMDSAKLKDDSADEYLTKYPLQKQMSAFFLLKALFAPCIESLILLDRLAFLLEQPHIQDAHLVRLFHPVTSPRCYAIVAQKKIKK